MQSKKGMVYLVGAGPGDPGLITVKGRELLKRAQVLVYDRLASAELLSCVPETCEKIYVGKEPGHHSMKQEEISQVLVEHALRGKTVVRLKGGDPFVFGRGGEEILALERHGIPYEVVSGVTSAVAALAHAGIPVTHRGAAQSFHVITGHTAEPSDGGEESLTGGFSEYAKLSGTLVFLMGLSNLERIVEKLIENGKPEDTPSAVVTNGTLPSEKCVRAALKDLPEAVRKAGLTSPGIIVVGKAAAFCMKKEPDLPLCGVTVGITGTDGMYEKLSETLKAEGAAVIRAGISRVRPINQEELKDAVREIRKFSWVVFTSRNGVRLFFDAVKQCRMDIRALAGIRFAVIGKGTGEYLERYGIYADLKPEIYTTSALADLLRSSVKQGEKVLIPRAAQGSEILTETLSGAGIDYLDLPVYDISVEQCQEDGELHGQKPDYITFESGSGVRGYFEKDTERKRLSFAQGIRPVCIGKVTAEVLKEYGVSSALTAEDYTAEGIVDVILRDRNHE